jgi:tetratricopeptide (TPR) repeat protein
MPEKPSVIKCPKCGYLPNMLGDSCLKCGARLEKTCGECGFGNPVEKNYCDQCGALLALTPPPRDDSAPPPAQPEKEPAPKLEMESIQDTVSGKAQSFRNRQAGQPTPEEESKPAPPPQSPPREHYGSNSLIADSARLPKEAPPQAAPVPGFMRRFSGPALTALLTLVLLIILYLIAAPSIPRMRLVMTAKAYLTNISEGKYEKAYELLSANSKAVCGPEDYIKNSRSYYSKAPAWQFRDVQVFTIDQDAAMVRYQLKEGGGEWKNDYISFVREHNRWARPYIWVLFQPIDDAIKRQDFPQALFLAQKLYLTDPLDPRSSGYLCSTEFFMGIYDKAAESCRRTVDNAATYPVGYSTKELYWYNFYYADSLRYLQRDRVAIQEYEKLMKWPGLTAKEQCPLFLNRADSYVAINDYSRALQDVMAAEGVCFENPAKDDAKIRLAYMSGSAGAEAVAFAQKSRFQPGLPPIAEARRQQLETLKARLGPQGDKLMPRDQWLAVHLTGPEYRVFLRQESFNPRTRKRGLRDIFVFHVNLWTGKAKVEKAPNAPPPAEEEEEEK